MKYDFESIMNRSGRDAIAVDSLGKGDPSFTPRAPREGFDAIPMWVADMNFPTCPTIPEAIIERTKHPAYGYFELREEYYREIIDWQFRRNESSPNLCVKSFRCNAMYCTGMQCIPWLPVCTLEEAVKGAQHL